jgi:hypothetical protein
MSKIKKIVGSIKSSLINDSFSLTYDKRLYNITNEYFQLIQKIIQKYHNKKIIPKDSSLGHIHFPPNINYKILILKYFAFEFEKGNVWMKELYEKTMDQIFPSEEYFLYLFNISEFEIRTRPQCFQNIDKKVNYIPQSSYFTYDLIDENEVLSNDPLILHKLYKQEIYKFVKIIRDQIEAPINPINYMIRIFINCFSKQVINMRDELLSLKRKKQEALLEQEGKKILKNISKQIKDFIKKLSECLALLYSKINNKQIFSEESNEFTSLLTSLFFNQKDLKDDIYKIILDIIRIKNTKKIEKFKKLLITYKYAEPEDFGVKEKYCLTEKSVNYYMKCFRKNFGGNVPNVSFENSIKLMKNFYLYRKPIDKLLLINEMRMCILDEIEKFWKQVPEEFNTKELKLEMGADDSINIFEYIIIKSGMNDLVVHIDFIEAFIPEETLNNDKYFQQINVGLMQLNDLGNN